MIQVQHMALKVISAGPLTTVQDQGRLGYERFGVPQSGAMDWFALWAANRLVGNLPEAAGLEFILQGPELCPAMDCLVAVAGHGFSLTVGGRRVGAWRCALVRAGELIQVTPEDLSGWGYLAVSGGIDLPLVMGSRSTYLRGEFGGFAGRSLQPGDHLPIHPCDAVHWQQFAGRSLPRSNRISYASQVTVAVIPGPQQAVFGEEGLNQFFSADYQVQPSSDRMGYRLSGPPVPRCIPGELLSEGIAPGSIQIPPDGQPVVLLSDRPATGGYAKIATVARVAIPLLVQALPGVGVVRFQPVDVAEAQQLLRNLVSGIERGIANAED
jgi:antagonist of KipI